MNKEEIYEYLDSLNIKYEKTEHKAVYNMAELAEVELPHPEADAKNLFIRDDKKKNYYLISIKGDKKADLKTFRQKQGTRPLSFASENDLENILKLKPGSVTPLGLLNDKENKTVLYLDSDFVFPNSIIGVHPNDNTATVWLKTDDLIKIIESHGNKVIVTDI